MMPLRRNNNLSSFRSTAGESSGLTSRPCSSRLAVTPRTTRQERIRVRRGAGYAAAEEKQRSRTTEVAQIGPSEVIGDVEFIMALDSYCTTVVANSEVDCFVLDLKNIERLVSKRHALTSDLLAEAVSQKLEARSRLRAQAPLFDVLRCAMNARKPPPVPSPAESNAAKEDDPATREIRQQMRLFLMDRASLAPSCIKDGVQVRMHSARTSKYWNRRLADRADKRDTALTQEERLRRHRQRRAPQSIRQLQQLTVGAEGNLVSTRTAWREPSPRRKSASALPRHRAEEKVEGSEEEGENDTLDGTDVPSVRREARRRLQHLLMTNASDPDGDEGTNANILALVKIVQHLQDIRARKESGRRKRTNSSRRCRPISAPPNVVNTAAEEISPFVTDWGHRRRSTIRPQSAAVTREAFDWETSDEVLEELEDRIREFLDRLADGRARQKVTEGTARKDLTPLHRFEVNPDQIPRPGGTVLIWPRPCTGEATSNEHAHVRHFILPRNALAVMQSLRATDMRRDKEVLRTRPISAAARRPPSVPDVSLSELNRNLKKTRERTRSGLDEVIRQVKRPEN